MAMEDFYEAMCVVNKVSVPDGGGGFVWEWQDGAPFDGRIKLDASTQMQIAQQSGVKAVYNLTTRKSIPLETGALVKRMKDGAVFKVTADPADRQTPALSDLNAMSVSMERVTV